MKDHQFELEFHVRDYECDLQGVVNNAVYLNYLEHTRHEFLRSRGVDFAALSREGKDLVVIRSEIDYRSPLQSGESFLVTVTMEKISRLKILCHQSIYRLPDRQEVIQAKIFATGLNEKRRPKLPEEILVIFDSAPGSI